jgi:hypothetical protein
MPAYPYELATDVNTLPAVMFQMGQEISYNPHKMLFKNFCVHDPICFGAMLSLASKHMAATSGQADTVQSLTHKTRTIQMINSRLREGPNVYLQDEMIYSIGTISVVEV